MKNINKNKYLTPKEIVSSLDKYIIGQKKAKRSIAIALRNRWRRMSINSSIKDDVTPSNILMIGSTGIGKTEIARRLAKIINAPFIKVEASKFTEVGYVGRDVESMIRDLVECSIKMVKASKTKLVQNEAKVIVENIILDLLIPSIKKNKNSLSNFKNIKYDNIQDLNEKTRNKLLQKIRDGELDDKEINININNTGNTIDSNNFIDESSINNLQDMINNILPKNIKKKVKISEAKKILLEDEVAKMIDVDTINKEAIINAENIGIVFIDEIDKIVSRGRNINFDINKEGVQRDLLPVVEGSSVNTKYGVCNTDHILFIAAGAFHISKPSDLIPELQGRFPIKVELDSLTQDDFYKILKEPKNSITKQYEEIFKSENVQIIFEEDAIQEISKISFDFNNELENIGARRLHTIMSCILNDFLFDVPDKILSGEKIIINKKIVLHSTKKMSLKNNLNEYIL